MKVLAHIEAFLKDEEGASGIEYALIAGMLAAVLISVSTPLGNAVRTKFNSVIVALGGTAVQ